jgi:hypothetical protein
MSGNYRRAVIDTLKANGWHSDRFNSKHEVFAREGTPQKVPIGMHINDRNFAMRILRQAGIRDVRL